MSAQTAGRRARAHSLGRRLSGWLALQGLATALVVSAVLYGLNLVSVRDREQEDLDLAVKVISHAMGEAAETSDLVELRHRLDDFHARREDVSLQVVGSSGRTLYASTPRFETSPTQRWRSHSWSQRWPADAAGEVQVTLQFDVGRDEAMLARLGSATLLVSLVGALLASVTGYMLVRRGLRPVGNLAAELDAVALSDHRPRIDGADQPLELEPLVGHINALLERAERAYLQLEGFNADVAHELRNPLTTLIGSSELALQRDRPAAELREVIGGNLEDLRRLAGIVNDMLFLSRADRGEPARRLRVDSLAACLAEVLDFHEAALDERGLRAACVGDAAGAFDIALLRRAVSNLVGNASRYAEPRSTIVVRIEAEGGKSRVRLAVENRGPEIPREHLQRIFDRFYRVETSRPQAGAAKQYGLGLAIVAAIARMHGGCTFAHSADGVTTIGLELPLDVPTPRATR